MSTGQNTYEGLAALYDIAFSWDVGEEVDWLIGRLGPEVPSILEPACGSGRMIPAFAQRGVEVVGIELSETMIQRAQQRMGALALPAPRILQGDMAHFALGETFDGAICPINSFAYLPSDSTALSHLQCVALHLVTDGKYFVQVDLMDTSASVEYAWDERNRWEVDCGGLRVRTTWSALRFDAVTRLQTELCRFEVLGNGPAGSTAGPPSIPRWNLPTEVHAAKFLERLQAGAVFEDQHIARKWNWSQWQALIVASPFRLAAAYDGDGNGGYAPLPLDRRLEGRHLVWHELVVRHPAT